MRGRCIANSAIFKKTKLAVEGFVTTSAVGDCLCSASLEVRIPDHDRPTGRGRIQIEVSRIGCVESAAVEQALRDCDGPGRSGSPQRSRGIRLTRTERIDKRKAELAFLYYNSGVRSIVEVSAAVQREVNTI